MDLPIVVPLTRPIVVGDKTYDTLSFDEPDLDAQIAYAELEETFPEPKMVPQDDGPDLPEYPRILAAKVNRFWLAHLAGVSEQVVGKIKGSDLDAVNAAADTILGFTSSQGEGTGDTSGNETPAK